MQAAFLSRLALALAVFTLAGCQKDDPAAAALARDAQVTAALDAANQQLADGQIGPAIAALDALYNANPGRYDIVENLATAQAHAGNLPKAAALFAQAAKADPSRRALFIYAAGLDTSAGNHPDAVAQYTEYLKYFPHDNPARKNLARELRALNQIQPALDTYLDALKQSPSSQLSAEDALEIALLYQQLGDRPHAISWFQRVPNLQPDPETLARWQKSAPASVINKNLAEKIAAQKNTPAPAASLTAAPASSFLPAPSSTLPASSTPANATLTLAANATPPPPTANLTITPSNTTLALTPHTTTQSQTPASSPASPSSTLPTSSPSAPLVVSSSPNSALLTPNSALTPSPQPAPTTQQSALSNQQSSSPPAPTSTLPASSDPLLAAAQTSAAAGNFTNAIRDYWKALANDDSSPDTWLALGQAYLANKQYPDAASVAQEAIRRAPDNAAYTVFSLQVEKISQSPARYQTDLSAAFQKFPDNADLALTLSDAFHQQGDTRDASLVLTNYLGHAPATDPRRNDVQDALDNLAGNPPAKSP